MAKTTQEPLGKVEQMLCDMIDGEPIVEAPENRIEGLLMELAEAIEEGGGGTGEVTGVKGSAESTYRKGNVSISKDNIGLGNIDNTSDLNKPVSTAQQTALDGKVDKVTGKGLSTNDYDDTAKAAVDALGTASTKDATTYISPGNLDVPTADATYKAMTSMLDGAFHPSGNKTVAELTSDLLIQANVGNVYKITDSGVTDANWVGGAGQTITANQMAVVVFGNESNTFLFNLENGINIDMSAYQTKAITPIEVDGVTKSNVEDAVDAINVLAGNNKSAIGNIKDGTNIDSFADVETALADKADDTSVYKTFSFGNTGSGGGTVKYIELTGAYPNNAAKENSYMITGRNGESAILVLPTGMAIGVYNDPRLLYLTRGTSTPIVSANLDSTNGKVYIGIGSYTYVHISQIGGERANWSGEIITELPSGATTVAIVSDVANKADKVASATNGDFAGLDANGNLKDSGKKASDFVSRVASATAGHIVMLDSDGDIEDSGIPAVIVPSGASASNKLATMADIGGTVGGRQLPLIDLGTSYSAELKQDISQGKFEKAVVGGFLTINGHVYYLAHPDYWLHTGDTECTAHHMLVVPAGNIGTGKMNNSNITTGAYAGSDMKTGNNSNTALATAAAQIKADFGAANILTHRELFANAVTDGKASGWAWADSDIDLMNEVMVYGCNVWASAPGYETGIDKCQIKLFQERPDLITTRANWWLRSVVSAAGFAAVHANGYANYDLASTAFGVRPAFAIC